MTEESIHQEGTTSAYEAELRRQRLADMVEFVLVLPRLLTWPLLFFALTSLAIGNPAFDLTVPVADGALRLGWGETLALLAILVGGSNATSAALDERRARRMFDEEVEAIGAAMRRMSPDAIPTFIDENRRLSDRAIAAGDVEALRALTTTRLYLAANDVEAAYEAMSVLRARRR